MTRDEVVLFLTYVQMFDNRPLTHEIIDAWHGLRTVQHADLATAKAAVEVFFNEGATGPADRTWFDSRHFTRCVRIVKREREVEAAKERAKRFQLTTAYTPPAGGWRSLVPGGYGDPAPPRVVEKHPTQSIPVITTSIPVVKPAKRQDLGTFLDGFGAMA